MLPLCLKGNFEGDFFLSGSSSVYRKDEGYKNPALKVNNISGPLVVGKVHEVLKCTQSLSPLNQPGFRNTGEGKKEVTG